MATRKLPKRKVPANQAGTTVPLMERLAADLLAAKDAAARAAALVADIEQQLIKEMTRYGFGVSEKYDGERYAIDRRQSHGTIVDWEGLKKELTPEQWAVITPPAEPSKSLLEAAITTNAVKADVVKPFLTDKPHKEYISITPK